jgi:hypothetical protein
VLRPSPYHNPLLDIFQNCNTLLNSLNVRNSRGLEQLQSMNLANSAQVTRIRKDDWSRAVHDEPMEVDVPQERVKVAQVAPMGAHAAVRMPGGLTDPCHGVGVPKCRKSWGVHTARKTPYFGGNPGKRPESRTFAPLDSRALKAP